ncbi:hypothetical protein KIL84_001280 [Mauremys mutica]|uniref:Uncharacterized protein n=1 Tax=Mauremys mutica TaxID=74926 RepID=A0A9D4AVQ1_9SAUR|nr:hypothetical protein KIL84_001280 [Mauremys mutica]
MQQGRLFQGTLADKHLVLQQASCEKLCVLKEVAFCLIIHLMLHDPHHRRLKGVKCNTSPAQEQWKHSLYDTISKPGHREKEGVDHNA